MNYEFTSRTRQLIGDHAVATLEAAHVLVVGIGGVGSYTVEALARSGVGALTLVDSDVVAESNINRQLIALRSTLGRPKVDVMRERLLDINPDIRATALHMRYDAQTADTLDMTRFDFVVDAIDAVDAKVELVARARAANVPVISSMGTGNKLDPTRFRVCDIATTHNCPLARAVRKKLRKRGIETLDVLFSDELPHSYSALRTPHSALAPPPPASIAFVPSVAGLIIAGEVVKRLIGKPAPCNA